MNNCNNFIFLYPSDALNKDVIDEQYQKEANCMHKNGLLTAIISLENMEVGIKLKNVATEVTQECKVIYRGWMLPAREYSNLVKVLQKQKMTPLISINNYLSTHYLPNWYPFISDLTPETAVFEVTEDLPSQLVSLGWSKYFVKDYVKSLKTSVGSFVRSPEEILKVISEMKKFRGDIEGGICVRRVERYELNSEKRYFVINGHPFFFDKNANIPEIVYQCVNRINSPFFSIDVAKTIDGQLRIVEIGDGQVSDLVGWSVKRFVDIWLQSL